MEELVLIIGGKRKAVARLIRKSGKAELNVKVIKRFDGDKIAVRSNDGETIELSNTYNVKISKFSPFALFIGNENECSFGASKGFCGDTSNPFLEMKDNCGGVIEERNSEKEDCDIIFGENENIEEKHNAIIDNENDVDVTKESVAGEYSENTVNEQSVFENEPKDFDSNSRDDLNLSESEEQKSDEETFNESIESEESVGERVDDAQKETENIENSFDDSNKDTEETGNEPIGFEGEVASFNYYKNEIPSCETAKDVIEYISGEKNDKETDNEKIAYYLEIKDSLDDLFERFPKDEYLSETIPSSRWVKIDYDGSGKSYSVGVLTDGEEVVYIGYGIRAHFSKTLPSSIKSVAQWVPLDFTYPKGEGYFMIYQKASDGSNAI